MTLSQDAAWALDTHTKLLNNNQLTEPPTDYQLITSIFQGRFPGESSYSFTPFVAAP